MSKLASPTQSKPGRGRTVSPLLVHRIAAGLTQRELAAITGLVPETISNAERGRHRPRGLTARALAAALGCLPVELFPDDERRPVQVGAAKESAGQGPTDGP